VRALDRAAGPQRLAHELGQAHAVDPAPSAPRRIFRPSRRGSMVISPAA
jgi:hypothetical protein